MRLVDLSLELYDGFQSHGAHARTTVMDFNLDQIGRPRFTFIGLPLRIRGATGSPIRAVAVLD